MITQGGASEIADAIVAALVEACAAPHGTDWNDREAVAHAYLSQRAEISGGHEILPGDVFLGGDSLRPYLTVDLGKEVWLTSRSSVGLSTPRLLNEIGSGHFGLPTMSVVLVRQNQDYAVQSLVADSQLHQYLSIPGVLFVSLTNPSRYQTRRYPLNIARLAQWLRFEHAGRAAAVDLALEFGGDIQGLANRIVLSKADVLGISVNFGEMKTFEALMVALRVTKFRPIICVGNVLAAWAPDQVVDVCSGFPLCLSYSYGETAIQGVCRVLASGTRDAFAAGVVHLDRHEEPLRLRPTSIVVPDERLLAQTLKLGGQASIETSFGCQYARCSFCPRGHRGSGWSRPAVGDAKAVVQKVASLVSDLSTERSGVLSIVDEDAFGQEGMDAGSHEPLIVSLVETAGPLGVGLEIYTRLEQLFSRRRARSASVDRLEQLRRMAPSLVRVFVGVESGCDSQLRRYAKGQTTSEAIDALRAGSLLGLPLEFGFITFDPLLSADELIENIEFLLRTDVLPSARPELDGEQIYALLQSGSDGEKFRGGPVFARVAYMATELELFANSAYLRRLRKSHPELIGAYDEAFARYAYRYRSREVGTIAAWCRVWTEGTFKPIYRMRLAGRANKGPSNPYENAIRRYRAATFGLLLSLAGRCLPSFGVRARALSIALDTSIPLEFDANRVSLEELRELWQWWAAVSPVATMNDEAEFNLDHLEMGRAT